jgi:L-galactose dehydrogenase/L-glyceraldehyde 3-phosphate reductase
MLTRPFGRSGLNLSVLGLGCGAVGGLMVRGTPSDRECAVAMARDAGVNYFDTAVQYGDGLSETHLGAALAALGMPDAIVGTKVRLKSHQFGAIAETVAASLDASLRRLGRDHVTIFHLHNAITESGGGEALSIAQVLGDVLPAFTRLREAGKTRLIGITAVGETAALHRVIASGLVQSAQIVINLINPTAVRKPPPGFTGQDYAELALAAQRHGCGGIGIRILAGGALSGSMERHEIASPAPEPIGSGDDYAADVAAAAHFMPLVEQGRAGSLVEAAIRFAIGHESVAPSLIGVASLAQLQAALDAAAKAPLAI